ncbi:MAG: hypothetical protein WDN49_04825 [Acetobacteraceae bacterium]
MMPACCFQTAWKGVKRRVGAMPPGCDCARVVMGRLSPLQCRLYGRACTPRTPVGPCMVSDEGGVSHLVDQRPPIGLGACCRPVASPQERNAG